MFEKKKEDDREEKDQEQDHHIPSPPSQHPHQQKRWEHLPGSKKKPVRSYKSPGRK